MEEAAERRADAARLDALESTVAEIWRAVREREPRPSSGSDSDQPGQDNAALCNQVQRLEERLGRRTSRALYSAHHLNCAFQGTCFDMQFVSCTVEEMLSQSAGAGLASGSAPRTPAAVQPGSPPARHTRARSETRRFSRGKTHSQAEEISALMRPDARRAKSAPRARAPAAQIRSQIKALQDEFASFSMQIDRKQTAQPTGGSSRNGRSRSRPRNATTPRSQGGTGDAWTETPRTPRSRSRQRGASQASRPPWSNAGVKSPVGLGRVPSGQGPRRSSEQSARYGRSKSTPRQQRYSPEDDPPAVYSRRLARRHAALQREVEVASVVENAAHHGVLDDGLAAKLGQRKLRQREMQLQDQSSAYGSSNGSRRAASPPPKYSDGRNRGDRRAGSASGRSSSAGSYEVWQGRSAVRLEDELRGGRGNRLQPHQPDFKVRPWSPGRDGPVWNTLDETAERGSAHSPGNDRHARAEYARREAMLAHSKAEMHRMRSMGTMLVFVVAATRIQSWWRGWLVRQRPRFGQSDASSASFVMQARRRHIANMLLGSGPSPESLREQDSIGRYASEQALLASQEAERAMALVAAARSQLPSRSR